MSYEEFEEKKLELQNIESIKDVKNNPVVKSAISLIKSVPFFGEIIDSSIDATFDNNQKKKRAELLEYILSDKQNITSEMVNDIEFIYGYARVVEAINRLAKNDKIKYFANLLKNGYLVERDKVTADEFDEYLDSLNTLSFREIEWLIYMWKHTSQDQRRIAYKEWKTFSEEFIKKYPGIAPMFVYKRISRTGFINEVIDSANVEGDVVYLDIEFYGYEFDPNFEKFYRVVLKESDSKRE